jgi:hypothetical protein
MAGFVPLKNLKLQLQERDFPNLVSSLPYKKKKKVYWLDMQDLDMRMVCHMWKQDIQQYYLNNN